MSDTCQKCGSTIHYSQRRCAVCNTEAGFPNILACQRREEAEALLQRYDDARTSAGARGALTQLDAFEGAVASNSKAVMNRNLGALSNWLNGASELFLTFYNQMRYLGRVPSDNEWDSQRAAAEAAINPFCYEDLNFSALSLDGTGMHYYGPYTVTLKSVTIEDRASVFEINPFYFNKKHQIVAGRAPPCGYRAPWDVRAQLAVAKLHRQIAPNTVATEFPNILMEPRRGESDCDFIEVHIFGPVNRLGIERIVGPAPTDRADRNIWRQAKRKARDFGADVEEVA